MSNESAPECLTHKENRNVQVRLEHHRHRLTGNTKRRVFDTLFQTQQGKCAICGISQEELDARYPRHAPVYRKFIIDHCHSTGKIRGLLCGPCNNFLGIVESYGLPRYLSIPKGKYETELYWYPRLENWLDRNRDAVLFYMQEEATE